MAEKKGSLGWPSVWALAAGGMVGGGIYTALGVVIAVSGQWSWLSFLISGVLAFFTAYSYAKLSVYFEESGGAFRFFREINKNGVAGSLSWLLIIGYVLTISVYAFAFGHYLAFATGAGPLLTRVFAILIIGGLVGLNLMGVTKTKKVEIVIVLGNLAALIALAAVGLGNYDTTQLIAGIEPRPFWSAAIGAASIFMAYEGFQLLSYEYNEIKNPRKFLTPTLLTAVIFVIVIYIAVAIGAPMLAGSLSLIMQKQVSLSVAARSALGSTGLWIMTIAAVCATAAAINSTLFSTANLSKRVANDKELPSFFKHTNSNKVPDRSVIFIGVMAATLSIIGKLSTLVEAASLVFLFTFGSVNIIACKYVKKQWKWMPFTGSILAGIVALVLIARLIFTAPVPLAILLGLAAVIVFIRPLILKKTVAHENK